MNSKVQLVCTYGTLVSKSLLSQIRIKMTTKLGKIYIENLYKKIKQTLLVQYTSRLLSLKSRRHKKVIHNDENHFLIER